MQLITTIFEVCGTGWLIVACLVALLNFIAAVLLTFRNRSVIALVAFGSVTLFPLWIGVIGCLLSIVEAIQLGMSGEANSLNTNLLVAMSLLPLAVGSALCIPAYATASLGRLWLATRGVAPPTASTPIKSVSAGDDEMAFQQYAEAVTVARQRGRR